MKNLFEVNKPKIREVKKPIKLKSKKYMPTDIIAKKRRKNKPTFIKVEQNTLDDKCRILPAYVAKNWSYWELLPAPRLRIKNIEGYVLRIIQKINCLKG